ADLPRREIDDAGDLAPDQLGCVIVLRDLRARLLRPNAGAEIDHELQRGLARFRKRLDRNDGADTDVDGEELVKGDLRSLRRVGIMSLVHVEFLPVGAQSRPSLSRRGYRASRAR